MEGSIEDYAYYRLNGAKEDLERARKAKEQEDYKMIMNRSYYAIFTVLRALLAEKEIEFKKHSAVISYFRREYIKNEIFDKKFSIP